MPYITACFKPHRAGMGSTLSQRQTPPPAGTTTSPSPAAPGAGTATCAWTRTCWARCSTPSPALTARYRSTPQWQQRGGTTSTMMAQHQRTRLHSVAENAPPSAREYHVTAERYQCLYPKISVYFYLSAWQLHVPAHRVPTCRRQHPCVTGSFIATGGEQKLGCRMTRHRV